MENEELLLEEEQRNIEIEEVIEIIEVSDVDAYTIESDDAFPALGAPNEGLKHTLLTATELSNLHPITAITGLREELDDIEALDVVYSNERNHANYYLWADDNIGQEDRVGYFVALIPNTNRIKVWAEGDEIFGVTVDSAAFVGGQADIARDISYGLVAHNGAIKVRCDSHVNAGDCVIANIDGVAQKTDNGYGYKVVDVEYQGDIKYAKIILNISANKAYALASAVDEVNRRLTNDEANITAAINVANEAYNKAGEVGEISEEAIKNALEALEKADDASQKTDEFESRLENANETAVQAKVIAESAAVSAESMRNEAFDKANEALDETSELRRELEVLSNNMIGNLSEAVLGLQASQEELEQTASGMQDSLDQTDKNVKELAKNLNPLIQWPEGVSGDEIVGVGGFVAQANENSITLGEIVAWKDGEGEDSFAGYIEKVGEGYATTTQFAEVGDAIAAVQTMAETNKASIEAITGVAGNLAGLQAQVNENTASVTTLASHVIGDYIAVDTWSATNKDTSKIYYAKDEKNYWYYDNGWQSTDKPYEAGLTGAIAGIQQIADDNAANIEMIASLEGDFGESLAGFVSEATANNAEIQALAEYGYTDNNGEKHYGAAGIMAEVNNNKSAIDAIAGQDGRIAGLQAQVDATTSEVALVANRVMGKYVVVDTWDEINRDTDTVYYAQDTKLYWYYDDKWTSTQDAYTAGLPAAIAGIQVVTDDNSSTINQLVSWQDDTENSMASIKQQADQNGASINMLVSSIDKYSVGERSQSYGLTYEEAKSILEEGVIYVPTVDHSEWFDDEGVQNAFTPGHYYEWAIINDHHELNWKVHTNSVTFAKFEPVANNQSQYWYIDSDEAPAGYAPRTLYKWDDAKLFWVAVSTLEYSESNRQASMLRLEVNKISADVVNARGDIASHQQWLDANSANILDVVSWQSDVKDDVSNIATIQQTADAAGASVAQIAGEICGTYTTIDGIWDDRTLKDTDEVYYTTEDKKYWYYKDGVWNSTNLPTEAGLEVNAASIVTAINNSETSVTLSGKHIVLNGAVTNGEGTFSISEDGHMTANGGKIGGWTLGETSLVSTAGDSTVSLYSFPYYWHNNDEETRERAAEVLTVQVGTETPFRLSKDGALECTKGNIAGWQIKDWGMGKENAEKKTGFGLYTAGVGDAEYNVLAIGTMSEGLSQSWNSCEFRVKGDGSLYSTKGNIAGWDITETQITRVQNFGTVEKPDHRRVSLAVGARPNDPDDTNLTAGNKQAAFYITKSDAENATFSVDWDGNLIANSAKITGTITANSVILNGVRLGRDPKTNTDAWHIGDEDYPRAIWADGSSGRVFLTPDGVVFRGTGEPLMKTWKELLS